MCVQYARLCSHTVSFDSFGPVMVTAVEAYVNNNLCLSLHLLHDNWETCLQRKANFSKRTFSRRTLKQISTVWALVLLLSTVTSILLPICLSVCVPDKEQYYPLLDVSWWSDSVLILARCSGSVTVSSARTLLNLLGKSCEWFEPSPRVTAAHDGGFLSLEVNV